jgi:glycosyltransferase involved in cell wall biosynthesis
VTADDVPRVSVIVPLLNQEKFLSEAVESALTRTYDPWELLLVNDGSTEASPDIVRENVGRRPGRIVFLPHPNGAPGPPLARNAGLRPAGDYVAFLDAEEIAARRGEERWVRARLLPSAIRYLSAPGIQDSGVYAKLERQPFECAPPPVGCVATRFRLRA